MTRGLMFVSLLWLLPAAAHAQDRERARVLFDEAEAARDAGDWQRVRGLLEQSLVAYPTFASAWNLVTALEELDDLPAAEAHLTRLLSGDFGVLDAAREPAVRERLARVSAELGTISVETGVPDLLVRLDGVARAYTEASGQVRIRATAGSHLLEVSSAEGQRMTRELTLGRGETRTVRLSFVTPVEPATLLLEALETSRTVRVIGVAEAVGRLDITLAPSEYEVELVGGGTRRSIVLAPGEHAHLVLERTVPIWESEWFWLALGGAAAASVGIALGVHFGTSQVLPPVDADFEPPPL